MPGVGAAVKPGISGGVMRDFALPPSPKGFVIPAEGFSSAAGAFPAGLKPLATVTKAACAACLQNRASHPSAGVTRSLAIKRRCPTYADDAGSTHVSTVDALHHLTAKKHSITDCLSSPS